MQHMVRIERAACFETKGVLRSIAEAWARNKLSKKAASALLGFCYPSGAFFPALTEADMASPVCVLHGLLLSAGCGRCTVVVFVWFGAVSDTASMIVVCISCRDVACIAMVGGM